MKVIELDIRVPDKLQEIFDKSRMIGEYSVSIFNVPPEYKEYVNDWFAENIQVENLKGRTGFSFLYMKAGENSAPHVDLLIPKNERTGEPGLDRICSLNIPLLGEEVTGHFEYCNSKGETIEKIKTHKPAIFQTNVLHRSVNEHGDKPRILFCIGFYDDSYEDLELLHNEGRLVR